MAVNSLRKMRDSRSASCATCENINLKKKIPPNIPRAIACGRTISRDFLHEAAAASNFPISPFNRASGAGAPFILVFIRQYCGGRVYRAGRRIVPGRLKLQCITLPLPPDRKRVWR